MFQTRARLSPPPVTTLAPSAEKLAHSIQPACACSTTGAPPPVAAQSLALWSRPAVSTRLPSGEIATAVTASSWPRSTPSSRAPLPSMAQVRAVWSALPVTASRPSVESATAVTAAEWPRSSATRAPAVDQSTVVPSAYPTSARLPSADTATSAAAPAVDASVRTRSAATTAEVSPSKIVGERAREVRDGAFAAVIAERSASASQPGCCARRDARPPRSTEERSAERRRAPRSTSQERIATMMATTETQPVSPRRRTVEPLGC